MINTLSAALAPIDLPTTSGELLNLGDQWISSPAVVVFLRHYG